MTYDRRSFMSVFATAGLGSTLLPGVLWARVAGGGEITLETVKCAEEVAGLSFTDDQRKILVEALKDQAKQIAGIHAIPLANSVQPAVYFDPLAPGETPPAAGPIARGKMKRSSVPSRSAPSNLEDLAFSSVNELAELIRTRKVTSTQLTQMYLGRLERIDPKLHAVITLTRERALKQAAAADQEISRGKYRGPLHGIPWGAKDLLAVRGYPTTWGAGPYRDQVIDEDATVVQRLDEAGAVLIAKLSLGELAQGDVWFGRGPTDALSNEKTRTGQRTRNPWYPTPPESATSTAGYGSSGSSAGPGSTVAAGLVGFAIGTETLGSISSPSTRNGVTGLRPTFGRVPRTGAMALSWTMDKLGPMARTAEDCALVFDAIHGPDGLDRSCRAAPFHWDATRNLKTIRVGYVKSAFDMADTPVKAADGSDITHPHFTKPWDDKAIDVLRNTLGLNLIPVEIPAGDYNSIRMVLTAEAAAAFDELTRTGRDKELVQQGRFDWANSFRAARFIPAVEYINAQRARTLVMESWAKLMKNVDVIVTPTSAYNLAQLTATNLTGHPAVILPHGFREFDTARNDKTLVPVSLTFLGGLYKEDALLAVASAYQRATDFHLKHPVL